MDEGQIAYMIKNGIPEADCSSCNKNIVGSIKPYAKHLVVCAGSSSLWISHVAEGGEDRIYDLFVEHSGAFLR